MTLNPSKTDPEPACRRAVVYMAWGERFVAQAVAAAKESRLPPGPRFLITDHETPLAADLGGLLPIRAPLPPGGKARKLALYKAVPKNFDSLLFLDVDTRVLDDVSLGFEKAEQHGLAMAQATQYSIEVFRGFAAVMEAEGVPPRGQLLYNSGVIFFAPGDRRVAEVFALAAELYDRHPDAPWGDQPYLTLAMEMLGFNPYTLSTGFNHRAFGELISGKVRIWHSWQRPPDNLGAREPGWLWRIESGALVKALKTPT